YNTDRPYSGQLPATAGRVSRHAWGDDYHRVLWARHNRLVDWMRDPSPEPFETSALVDSGPVQERVYAQYAGLGWVGKNTCLINPELGSWLFLGEIITTLSLEPDAQGLEQCGTCARCLEACPSGALVEPGVLDARRCLSYLTIEVRGGIPEPMREAMGTHAYGCDICQEVCPYNAAAPDRHPPDAALAPRDPHHAFPDLLALAAAGANQLRQFVKRTALRRVDRRRLLRNVAIALGNSADPRAVPAAAGLLAHPEPLVRGHAAWALAELATTTGADVAAMLADAAAREDDPFAADELAAARARVAALPAR
ncbi:MAG TPA: tRNA epoxyqueuosine(34) reductase QueG, partial [Kofleriaceae bacterium]|nr:tRNA epoxyqueuosine(34) reductase QueG [Kofleriaceae bacterium]